MRRGRKKSSHVGVHAGGSFPAGRWWLDDSGQRRFADDGKFVGSSVAERRQAFRHLGLVELRASPGYLHISWDVRLVARDSLIAAFQVVADAPLRISVILDTYFGGWNREIFVERNAALARMATLTDFKNAEPYAAVKLLKRDPSQVRQEGELLRSAFEVWDRSGGRFTWHPDSLYALVAPVALLFRTGRRDEVLNFMHVGAQSAAVRVFGKNWAKAAVGREAERSQPDFEFDDRVCDAYDLVRQTGEPYVDHIRAAIRRNGADPVWVPYRRLVVPARTAKGDPIVMSICDVRQDIDIPFMTA